MHLYHSITLAFRQGANGQLTTIPCSTPLTDSIYLTQVQMPTAHLFIAGRFHKSFGMAVNLDKGIIG